MLQCGGWVNSVTLTGLGASLVDASRGLEISRGDQRDSAGHNRGISHGHGTGKGRIVEFVAKLI